MRLINTATLHLESFPDDREVKYAILSHRWENDEVLFEYMSALGERREQVTQMKGFRKISMCCNQAEKDGLKYAWVDTCCIEKSSSAELQEAINSMYRWYSTAAVCYAYLCDVVCPDPDKSQFSASQWFNRGWTLQELIAPKTVIFFDEDWTAIGSRCGLSNDIELLTGIPSLILEKGFDRGETLSTAQIMSWARGRKTTRVEDRAYSLMGLFDVNMSMLYGEGDKAFKRLQEEIIRNTYDQSIYAWEEVKDHNPGFLARSADDFPPLKQAKALIIRTGPQAITNEGLSLTVDLRIWVPRIYLAVLNCVYDFNDPKDIDAIDTRGDKTESIGIFLRKVDDKGRFARTTYHGRNIWRSTREVYRGFDPADDRFKSIIVLKSLDSQIERSIMQAPVPFYGFRLAVFEESPSTFVEVLRTPNAIYDEAMNHLGLLEGTSGVAGEILLHHSPSYSFYIRVQLAFYKTFVPHCIIYSGKPIKSESSWWVGQSAWLDVERSWREPHDSKSYSITWNRSSQIGRLWQPQGNLAVLTPSFNQYNLEEAATDSTSTVIDAVLAVKDRKTSTEHSLRVVISSPDVNEELAPWKVDIYPEWAESRREESLEYVRSELTYRGKTRSSN